MIFGPKKFETREERIARETAWRPFFPLWPRHIDGVGYVWLEWIERRDWTESYRSGTDTVTAYRVMDPPWPCRQGDHLCSYLKTPSGLPMFRDRCVRCKRSPFEVPAK